MGSWTRSVSVRRWRALRGSLHTALVLMALLWPGGTLPRAAAQVPKAIMNVGFGPTTPPVELDPLTLCRGKNYQIRAVPYVALGTENFQKTFNIFGAKVSVLPATQGIIVPPEFQLSPEGGPAIFIYHADKVGQETLQFTAIMPKDVNMENGSDKTLVSLTGASISFKVKECAFTASMIANYGIADAGFALFGIMAETPLALNADGTYVGSAPFEFSATYNVPLCTITVPDWQTSTKITGILDPKTHQLTLTFVHGTAPYSQSGICGKVSKSYTETWDSSQFFPKTATFPEQGGTRSYPLKLGGVGAGSLTITVKQEGGS